MITWINSKNQTVTIEAQTSETFGLDGDQFERAVDIIWIRCEGMPCGMTLLEDGRIVDGVLEISHSCGRRIAANVPAEKMEEVRSLVDPWVARKNERKSVEKKAWAAENAREQQSRRNGLCPKCGSYCYGDCESN